MLVFDTALAGSCSPQIVVEKIISCKYDEEVGESTYCVKWENTWLPESVVSCMCPDLFAAFKKTNDYLDESHADAPVTLKESPPSITPFLTTTNFPDTQRLYDALDLAFPLKPLVDIETCDLNRQGLNLFTSNSEYCDLVESKQQMKSQLMEMTAIQKVDDNILNNSYESAGEPRLSERSKRVRKPTAKKIANEQLIKHKKQIKKKKHKNGEHNDHGVKRRRGRPADQNRVALNDPVQCDICGKVVRKKRLENHRALHSNNGKHMCSLCAKVCGTRSDLENHMLIHGDTNFTCEHCGQKFKQPAPYRIHLKTHTVEQNWMCDVCFQTFKFQGELKKHCLEDHADIAQNPQQCCVCKEKLKAPNSVYRHSVGHTGVRTFECGVCGKKFKHKSHLEKHLLMHERHEREKLNPLPTGPFYCEICGKQFDQIQSIRIHMGKHKANQENNLQEFLEKRALREKASKEKYRKNARAYKQKYKMIKTQKQRVLKGLGIEPDNPIVKTIDFKKLMADVPLIDNADDIIANVMVETDGIVEATGESSLLLEGESAAAAVVLATVDNQLTENTIENLVKANMEGSNVDVVIDTQHIDDADKGVEYVVSADSTVMVEHGNEVHEISMEALDSGLALLNFIRQGKSVL